MSSITSPIVGTSALLQSKNNTLPKTVSNYECDASSIPTQKVTRDVQYSKLKKMQCKMMDNGWRLCEGEGCEKDFFVHPTYPDTKFPAYYVDGDTTVILPIVNMENDSKGLGCSFIIKPEINYSVLQYNEWISYWSTRNGKRRAKYHNYLDEREQKKLAFEEEAVETLKLKKKANSNL